MTPSQSIGTEARDAYWDQIIAEMAPADATELDVDAEFSSLARAFSDVEDGDMIGVGCFECSEQRRA